MTSHFEMLRIEKAFVKVRAGLEFAAGPDRTQTSVKLWTLEFGLVLDALDILKSDIDNIFNPPTSIHKVIYDRQICSTCGREVASNWYIRHIRSGCTKGSAQE